MIRLPQASAALLLFSMTVAAQAGIFDPSPDQQPDRQPARSKPAPGAKPQPALGFVPNGSAKTILRSLDDAIQTIEAAMQQALADGKPARHDQLKTRKLQFEQLLAKAKSEPLPPSIYPVELGKKGCLFAIRESELPIQADDGPAISVNLQTISWFHVKVAARNKDQADAEIYDGTGKVRLYRVKLIGAMASRLEPGTTVRLTNVPFQCKVEEAGDDCAVYDLIEISLQEIMKSESATK